METNTKWRTFAEKVASGLTATEAYAQAGYKADNRRSVHSAAARLRAEPRVREYITELRQTADQISGEDTAFTLAAKLTLLARIAQTSAATVAESDEIIQYHRTFKDGGTATRLPCKLKAIKLHSELVGLVTKQSARPAATLTRDALREFLHELRLALQAAPKKNTRPSPREIPPPPDEPENIAPTQQKLTTPAVGTVGVARSQIGPQGERAGANEAKSESLAAIPDPPAPIKPAPIEPTPTPTPPELTPAAVRRSLRPAYGSFAPEPRPYSGDLPGTPPRRRGVIVIR